MTAASLSRSSHGRPAPPVRLLHLGLGNFFRAHQAWYTERAPEREAWGYAAFSGRSAGVVEALRAQEGLYTVITRSPDEDRFEVVGSLAESYPAGDHEAWRRLFGGPDLAAVTVTVTEAGYDPARPEVEADLAALRQDATAPVRSAPARLLAGLLARRRAGAGPLAVVPCDNLPDNGRVLEDVLSGLAALVDPSLGSWLREHVSVVGTVVDRITPRPAEGEREIVARSAGWDDRCPVVTEPFHEWILCGRFPAGRPSWEGAGARLVDDPVPFENRKLWLLNGAHSLLAYAGSIRGHQTVPDAAADPTCRAWVEEWWDLAGPHIRQPAGELAAYRQALLERFSNTRLADRLARIAEDGSQKIPVRILPVLRAERAAGRLPAAALRVPAAWICHLRGLGAPVHDARAAEVVPLADGPLSEAVRRVLGWLDPELAEDRDACAAVLSLCEEMSR